MLRRRLALPLILLGGAEVGLIGCAKELEKSPVVDPSKATVAQFDPVGQVARLRYPVPVLSLVPAPTGLAQVHDPQYSTLGAIDKTKVKPQDCEGATTKQCLQFVNGGWPTSTPITLYFSLDVDPASLASGILLFETPGNGMRVPVPLMGFDVKPRPVPPAACKQGGNGSMPLQTYEDVDVPTGVQVVVTPATPLKTQTRYTLVVKSSATGGIRGKDGARVESSALFALMNVPMSDAPVSADGKILSGLLRSSVRSAVQKAVAGNKSEEQLTVDERSQIEGGVAAKGADLADLYAFFNATITPLLPPSAGAIPDLDRTNLIFANTWSTEPNTLDFDPAASKVPFPNNPLLTKVSEPSLTNPSGIEVNLPICDEAALARQECTTLDSAQTQALLGGINTLDGFSTTASIAITFTSDVNPLTVDPTPLTPCTPDDCRIVMYPLSAMGTIETPAVDLIVGVLPGTPLAPPTINLRPVLPLAQDKNYVVAVKAGLEDLAGHKIASSATFELLKIPASFVNMDTVADIPIPGGTVAQAIACSFAATTGNLGSAAQVDATAKLLEIRVAHQRWIEGFKAIEGASPPIPRTDVLMAFTYKTQSLTPAVDTAKSFYRSWETRVLHYPGTPRVVGPLMTIQGPEAIARLVGVVSNLCVGLCQAGQLTNPVVPPDMCLDGAHQPTAAVTDHPLCSTAKLLVTGRLDRARLYLMNAYSALSGGPYQSVTAEHSAGTFTPGTLLTPRLDPIPIWVVTGTGTPSANGYPIAIFQHGLGSQKEAGFYIANTLAGTGGGMNPAGWATVLMDLPYHGSRASDIINNATGLPCDGMNGRPPPVDPAMVRCDAAGNCTGGCDGKQDPSGTGFLGLNLFATRDAFRQGTIDQLTLMRLLREEGKRGGALSYLDGTRIAYIGQSLGGITGGSLAAYVTPSEMKAMVLNVPGGGLAQNILPNSVEDILVPLLEGLAATGNCDFKDPANPGKGCKDTAGYRRFLQIAEWVLDPGDPLALTIGVTRMRPGSVPLTRSKILVQMSRPDPVVSNLSTYALLGGLGIKTDGTDDHFQPYDFTALPAARMGSGCHAWLLRPSCGRCLVDILCQTLGAQQQAAAFINSTAATVIPKTPAMVLPGTPPCANPCASM